MNSELWLNYLLCYFLISVMKMYKYIFLQHWIHWEKLFTKEHLTQCVFIEKNFERCFLNIQNNIFMSHQQQSEWLCGFGSMITYLNFMFIMIYVDYFPSCYCNDKSFSMKCWMFIIGMEGRFDQTQLSLHSQVQYKTTIDILPEYLRIWPRSIFSSIKLHKTTQ